MGIKTREMKKDHNKQKIYGKEDIGQSFRDSLRNDFILELLQVFNDYDVPLEMTPEDVREILKEQIK